MANSRFLARALNTKHADSVTIANTWGQGDTITLTINTRPFVVTIGTLVTTDQVATTLKQAFNGETLTDTAASCYPAIADRGAQGIAEFSELVATVTASVVTLTGRTAGVPHTITASEVTAGTGTATLASVTAASGQGFYDNANNWTEGSVPGASDAVYLDGESASIKYGLGNAGATLTSLMIAASYTGEIGLPKRNAIGYSEYRADYLAADCSLTRIGYGEGSGSGRIKLDNGSVQTALEIAKTNQSLDEFGLPAVLWVGTHASNTVELRGGSFGAAVHGGETATIATYRQSGGSSVLGVGCGLTTVLVEGGTLEINSAVTTLTITGGTVTTYGSGAITTVNLTGGRLNSNSSGTIGTLNIGGGSETVVIDFSGDSTPRTVTTTNAKPRAMIVQTPGVVTWTNAPAFDSAVRSIATG